MRQPDILRPIKLTTTLPEDIRAKLDLHLFSDLEGRIPKGAYQAFFIDRIQEFFDSRSLDLAKYLPGLPTSAIVRGSAAAISILDKLLTQGADDDIT
jgi:hypothetical protein